MRLGLMIILYPKKCDIPALEAQPGCKYPKSLPHACDLQASVYASVYSYMSGIGVVPTFLCVNVVDPEHVIRNCNGYLSPTKIL